MADHFFQLQHRRLRAKFSMATLERHADQLLSALYARRQALPSADRRSV